MGSLSIWHWLIVVGIVILVFWTHKSGSVGTGVEVAARNFKRAANIPAWLHVVVASILLLCLLVIARRLAAQ